MASFIARVELHAADYDDYEELHSYMQQKGYKRKITGDSGTTSKLPTGTYVMEDASISRSDALQRAVKAAEGTGKKSAVIVAEWSAASWQGLDKI